MMEGVEKMFGKIIRTLLLIIGWLSVGMGLLGLAVSIGEGVITKEDISFITFFLVAGGGVVFLVKRAEKKAETAAQPVVVNINVEHDHKLGEVRQVVCEGCGASIHADEGVTECEYCGSHISLV